MSCTEAKLGYARMRLRYAGDEGDEEPPPLIEIEDSDEEFVDCHEEPECANEEEEQVIACISSPLGFVQSRVLKHARI